MNPRLKTSKKWTAFPRAYSDQILAVFNENFATYLGNARLILEGRIYEEEVMLRVGYLEEGRLAQANFDISMNYSREDQDAIERIHNCVDAAAGMMLDYLENDGEVDLPYVWKEFSFQGKKLFLQFTTENSSLEAEANKLLGLGEDSLLHDEGESDEDALSRAEQSEELSPPRDHNSEDEGAKDEESDEEDDGTAPASDLKTRPHSRKKLH